MTNNELANLLFPDVTETISDLQHKYPPRPDGQVVVRIAPSPTGFIHFGSVFIAIVDYMFAHDNGGVFLMRVEDTDQKRLVKGGINNIVDTLKRVGITMHEGPLGANNSDIGNYGPYIQSDRKHLYRVFAKHFVEQGLAYPCRMSTEELDAIGNEQMKTKKAPGIYGNYSLWRNKTNSEYEAQFAQDPSFVLRLRSPGDFGKRIVFEDLNRSKVSMPENTNDAVLLKSSDNLPTYHFAMLVDDSLMGISHVIRGEEWLTSVPLHIQLYSMLGKTPPQRCHLPLILKLDNGKKRKISKRYDPEASVDYLFEQGYAPDGIVSFALSLINSNFEEWLKINPKAHYSEFDMKLEKIGSSGVLFDLEKFNFINNFYLSKISNQQLFDETLDRAQKYRPDFANLLLSDPQYGLAAMSIERHTDLDPKRFNTYADVESQVRFFFDEEYKKIVSDTVANNTRPSRPSMITTELAQQLVTDYSQKLDVGLSKEQRFEQLKDIGKQWGFASTNAEFKAGGYIGKIGDLAMFLRIQLACSTRTPDLYNMMQVMGKQRVIERLRFGY